MKTPSEIPDGSARRRYGRVPIVEIDGEKIAAVIEGKLCGLKRRPLPDGRYYIIYPDGGRRLKTVTRSKTFGKDPIFAIYRFVCWREKIMMRYRKRMRRTRRQPSVCPRCKGTGRV